jgi:hypothetical protein
MNSNRVDEIAALRAQKKLDREAEIEAREAKEAEEAKSHAANMERIAKKMAKIASGQDAVVEEPIVEEPAAIEPVVEDMDGVKVVEPVVRKPKPAPKKKAAVKKPAAKGKSRGRPKGSKNKK